MVDQGRNAPDGFYDSPEIEPHLIWLWNAFLELGTERHLGMAIGPIPGSKIGEYLRDEMELTGPEYDRARAIIRKTDEAYCEMLNSRKSNEPVLDDVAKATDSEGVKRIVRGIGNRHKATNRRVPK
jgi:hypothetical protein